MTKVREAFDKFDEDKSGAIDMWELRKVLQSMGQVRKAPCREVEWCLPLSCRF